MNSNLAALALVSCLVFLVSALGMFMVYFELRSEKQFLIWSVATLFGAAANGLYFYHMGLGREFPLFRPLQDVLGLGMLVALLLGLQCRSPSFPPTRTLLSWGGLLLLYSLVFISIGGVHQGVPPDPPLLYLYNGAIFGMDALLIRAISRRSGRAGRALSLLLIGLCVLSMLTAESRIIRAATGWGFDWESSFLLGTLVSTSGIQSMGLLLALQTFVEARERLVMTEITRDTFMEGIQESAFVTDLGGAILEVNDTMAERFGRSRQNLLGTCVFDLLPSDLAASRRVQWREGLATGRPWRFVDERSGRREEHRLFPLFGGDGKVDRVAVLAFDITERQRAEARLRESEQRFRSFIEQAPVAIGIARGRTIIYVNTDFVHLFGYESADEVVGTFFDLYVVPEARQGFVGRIQQRDAGETGSTQYEVEAVRRDGTRFTTLGSLSWVDLEDGPATIALFVDVTERKQIEMALRAAKEAAESAVRMRAQFLANMSHEIRTPMNVITGLSYLALESDSREQRQAYLGRILGAAESLLGVINDILDSSKIEAGKMTLEHVVFRLADVLEPVRTLLAQQLEERQLQLTFFVAPDVPDRLVGDPLRLRQILQNLASNAVKFTRVGGVEVNVSRCPVAEGVRLRFAVSDTGIGMDSEVQARVLAPFAQADGSVTRHYGGTGLGLSIVKSLIELMGSTLDMESEPGRGSRFSFTVDLDRPAPGTCDEAKDTGEMTEERLTSIRGARVLVVEDNLVNQKVAAGLLERMGVEVEIVGNGQLAVEAVSRGERFDLILMDVQMPEMDGYEATRQIRRLFPPAELPIVAMTAHAFVEEQESCLAAGMNEHMAKPIEPKKLRACLARWIRPRAAPLPVEHRRDP